MPGRQTTAKIRLNADARQASAVPQGGVMHNYRNYRQPLAAIGIVVALLVWSPGHARDADNLPNVMILATGGTIAGAGTTSTTTIGYTAATVGVQAPLPSRGLR